jgi:hypothetical protein
MTRGGSRKRHQSLRKITDENDHFQTGQGEEIRPPAAQCTSPRREEPEEFTGMNPSNTGHGRQNPSVNSKKNQIQRIRRRMRRKRMRMMMRRRRR